VATVEFTEPDIADVARSSLTDEELQSAVVYWYSPLVREGEQPIGLPVAMPFTGAVVFVDLFPVKNWAHPCRYLLVEPVTRRVTVVPASLPPTIDTTDERFVVVLRHGEPPPG
jgi:hypothetical protein